jgi:hypothetical protein
MKKMISSIVLLLVSVQAFAESVIAKTAGRAPGDIANNQLMASGIPAVDTFTLFVYAFNALAIAWIVFFVCKNTQMSTMQLAPVKK